MAELMSQANTTLPGKMFWTTGKNNKARDVELTAYMVLNLIRKDMMSEALQAIRWLATQRNSRGGFVSTQDTMIALQAISAYSTKLRKTNTDLIVDAAVQGEDEDTPQHGLAFVIDEDNQLIYDRVKIPLPSQSTRVSFTVQGSGCFMVQTMLRYNLQASPDEPVFQLTAQLKDERLKVCAAYDGGKDATDMVVIEIEMLSGYEPVTSSLEDLVNAKESSVPVKKFEFDEKEQTVALYFNAMTKENNCWEMEVKQVTKIEKLKPAIVKIYDYYDPKETFSTKYEEP